MTTVSFEYFEQRAKRLAVHVNEFNIWCKTNHISSLTEWMLDNSIEIHELYGTGLIDYIELFGPVGITPYATITITTSGKEVLHMYMENELIDLYNDEYRFYYITDRLTLDNKFFEYKNKSDSEKRRLYVDYHVHRYGYKPEPLDDELPFEDRSYIAGPFCDIEYAKQALDYCSWCGTFLLNKPTLQIGNNKLCYRCAKIAYQHLLKNAAIISRFNQNQQRKYKRNLSNWNNSYRYHLNKKSLLTILYELFTGDKYKHSNEFLLKNQKPIDFIPYNDTPSLTMYLNKNSKIIKNPREILKRDKHKCQLCGSVFNLEVHHIQPKSKGGKNYSDNLITLCKTCHDNEYWFDHFRAYKNEDSEFCHEPPSWEWELKPDLLTKRIRDLISEGNLFDGYKIINCD